MNTTAIITARGGSKGIPRKNIKLICGEPLIAWTIKAAKSSKHVTAIYVSTEDDEIAKISKSFGAEIIERPKELSQDTSDSESVLAHAISELESQGKDLGDILLLQPTSPLRTGKHIDEAINLYREKQANCVISVYEPDQSIVKAYVQESDGQIVGILNRNAPYTRRQDLPKVFLPNGAIYVFSSRRFNKYKQIPRDNVHPYVMSQKASIDIDNQDDFDQAQKLLEEQIL